MKMDPTEIEAAKLFTAEVKSIVHQNYPNNPLNPIGSHSSGLADRLSDFDFTLSFPDLEKRPLARGPSSTRPLSRKIGAQALRSIFLSLHKSRRYHDIEIIRARVPIVKAIHRKTKLRVELQTLSSNGAAREYTLYFLAEFPTLRPLYILFRGALHLRQLNIVYEGGLGSYSVLIMIVNALKHASGKYARDDLVGHFLHVLEFYSTADLYKYGFSPDPPRTFHKNRKMSSAEKGAQSSDPMLRGLETMRTYDIRKPYLLCLQDPANAVNDLGWRAYGIKHIQKVFAVIREGLITNMKAWNGDGQFEEPWHARGLLAPLLAANYSRLEQKRLRIKKWVSEKHSQHQHDSGIINDQESRVRFVVPTEQLANNDLSPLDTSSRAEEFNHNISESASGELRIVSSDVSEEKDWDTQSHRSPVETADQSNETSIQATKAIDTVKGKPDVLQGNLLAVQEPSQSKKHRNVQSRGWKKWVPQQELASQPKEEPSNSKGNIDQNTKASGSCTLTSVKKQKRRR